MSGPPPLKARRLLLAPLAAAAVTYALMQALIVPVLPLLEQRLGVGTSAAGWIMTSFLLSAAALTPVLGRLGDLYGKRRVLLAILAAFGLGSLVCAMAGSLEVLIIGRVAQGAIAGVVPLSFGIVRDQLAVERVAGAVGLITSLLGAGAGAGVALAGVVAQHADVRWLFLGPCALSLVTALAVHRFVPESRGQPGVGVNWAGAALLAVGVACTLAGITRALLVGWGSGSTPALTATGAASLVLWVRSELRARTPLVDMRMMRRRGVLVANVSTLLAGAATIASFLLIPQLAQEAPSTGVGFGQPAATAGLYLLPWTMAMLVLSQLTGHVHRRFGVRVPLVVGGLVSGSAFALVIVAHQHPIHLLTVSALLGAGVGLTFAAMSNLAVESVPAGYTGVVAGVNNVMRLIGGAVGGQVALTLVEQAATSKGGRESGYVLAFALSGAVTLAATAAGFAAPRRARLDKRGRPD